MGKAVSNVLGGAAKAITGGIKSIVQPVYNATLKNIPGVDNALLGLDKAVGKAIPGGWGTIASIAASFIPGGSPLLMGLSKTAAMTGLGALTGSGVMRGDHQFNLQGAIMGGALAYGASNLADGLAEAGGGANQAIERSTENIAKNLGVEGANTGIGSQARMLAEQNAGFGAEGIKSIASGANQSIQSNLASGATTGFSNTAANPDVFSGLSGTKAIAPQPTGLENLVQSVKDTGSNMVDAGVGLKNITTGASNVPASMTLTNTALPIIGGATGLAAIDEQRKYLDQQMAAGTIAQAEYDAQLAEIDRQYNIAKGAVAANPFNSNPSTTPSLDLATLYKGTSPSDTLYDKSGSSSGTLYAATGGAIDAEAGNDDNYADGGLGTLSNGVHFAKGGEAKQRRKYFEMLEAEFNPAQSQYIEGLGYQSAPPAVQGRLGANFDALGGNVRVGASGNAMMGPDKRIMARPEMMDIGYSGRVGPGDLDVGIQRAIQAMPGRAKDYAINAKYSMNFAEGGQPRFLSGGGDGMSDSIRASIEGKQEARLADGEFVVPADVVSHLGNGSSKAGAKQLYAMMDKVRQARTGTKQQGKQINPRKYLAA